MAWVYENKQGMCTNGDDVPQSRTERERAERVFLFSIGARAGAQHGAFTALCLGCASEGVRGGI